MNKNDGVFIRRWAKKIKAVDLLGGKCNRCGEDDIMVMSFHHTASKKDRLVSMLQDKDWEAIEEELKNTILVCERCHRVIHHEQHGCIETEWKNGKEICLAFRQIFACEECGYDEYSGALEFCDKLKGKPIGKLIQRSWKTVEDLQSHIKEKLLRCRVLCTNCRRKLAAPAVKFISLQDKIYAQVANMRVRQRRVDVSEVKRLLLAGYKQSEIVVQLNCAKSTISMIIKRHNMEYPSKLE